MRARTTATSISIGAVVIAWGCGGAPRGGSDEPGAGWQCNDRMAGYVGHGTMGAQEIGVAVDCAERGPRIVRWRVDAAGTRAEDARGITPGAFDAIWRKLDGTGWRDQHDCTAGGENDPVYTFSFKDWQAQRTFACQSIDPPFPYHTILDELDLAANRGQPQLGPRDDGEGP
jgi:hypothetical protein